MPGYLSKAILAACLVAAPAAARDSPAIMADGQPIDNLIETVVAKRKAAVDAAKAQATAEAELKAAVEALNKRLTELGLNGPVVPPGPVIPTPPVDPLAARLWAAYRADASATKAAALADMVELMRQAQAMSDDATITTVGALAGKVASVAASMNKDQIAGVRAILKVELATAFPSDGPLALETRAAARAVFLKLQTALTEAGK